MIDNIMTTKELANELVEIIQEDNFVEKTSRTMVFQKNSKSPKVILSGDFEYSYLGGDCRSISIAIISPNPNDAGINGRCELSQSEVAYLFKTHTQYQIATIICSIMKKVKKKNLETQISNKIKNFPNIFKKSVDK